MSPPVFILGGAQTDFARNWSREGATIFDLVAAATLGALERSGVDASEIETAHVGNFNGQLFARQGQLGGLLVAVDPAFDGLPTMRHEAACASGSVATLAATAELDAGRYDVALIVGVEQMRNVDGETAARNLGVAAWTGREAEEARWLWPWMFDRLLDEYDRRYGVDYEHLMALARQAFESARANPRAQTRAWRFEPGAFTADDVLNPVVEGRIRRQDCGQLTDGAAAVVLARGDFAARWARRRGVPLEQIPRIEGWGHRTSTLRLADKLAASDGQPFVFPHVHGTLADAWRRAGLGTAPASALGAIDGLEVHDCFSITAYMILDHLGLAPPGEPWRLIEDGSLARDGRLPFNPSGGLIGAGHPVGATGVRMLFDAWEQVSGAAGERQIPGARRLQTLNIGGSATTTVSFVVGA